MATELEKGIRIGIKRALEAVELEIQAAKKELSYGGLSASVRERAQVRKRYAEKLRRAIGKVSSNA